MAPSTVGILPLPDKVLQRAPVGRQAASRCAWCRIAQAARSSCWVGCCKGAQALQQTGASHTHRHAWPSECDLLEHAAYAAMCIDASTVVHSLRFCIEIFISFTCPVPPLPGWRRRPTAVLWCMNLDCGPAPVVHICLLATASTEICSQALQGSAGGRQPKHRVGFAAARADSSTTVRTPVGLQQRHRSARNRRPLRQKSRGCAPRFPASPAAHGINHRLRPGAAGAPAAPGPAAAAALLPLGTAAAPSALRQPPAVASVPSSPQKRRSW